MNIKRLLIISAILASVQFASSQNSVINMDEFWNYQYELMQAEKSKDRAKIKELKDTYGAKFTRKDIEARAKKEERYFRSDKSRVDREALALAAAYHELDYYAKGRNKDLVLAIKYYDKVTSYDNQDSVISQVLWSYACFLKYLYNHFDKTIQYAYYDQCLWYTNMHIDQNDKERIKKSIFGNIGHMIESAGQNGYKLCAYYAARLYRHYHIPFGIYDDWDIEPAMHAKWYSNMIRSCDNLPNDIFQSRIDKVVEYYSIAATNGKPQHQFEFAEYLFLTMCSNWKSNIWCTFGMETRPFEYKSQYIYDRDVQNYYGGQYGKVLERSDIVDNEIPDNEIEEQLCYWFLQAAKQDYTPAMVNLAFCMYYQMHPYDDSLHYSNMVYWLEKASNLGNTTAMYNLSIINMSRRNPKDAFAWAKRGADSGDVECQHLLGRYYYYGQGIHIDKHEALRWFKAAADNGSEGAAYMAGILYADKNVGNNMALAAKYYESTSRIGEAYLKLAECYSKGDGVVMDKQKAHSYEKKANEECYSCVSYDTFVPGLCCYSYALTQENSYDWKAEPGVLKQVQL